MYRYALNRKPVKYGSSLKSAKLQSTKSFAKTCKNNNNNNKNTEGKNK